MGGFFRLVAEVKADKADRPDAALSGDMSLLVLSSSPPSQSMHLAGEDDGNRLHRSHDAARGAGAAGDEAPLRKSERKESKREAREVLDQEFMDRETVIYTFTEDDALLQRAAVGERELEQTLDINANKMSTLVSRLVLDDDDFRARGGGRVILLLSPEGLLRKRVGDVELVAASAAALPAPSEAKHLRGALDGAQEPGVLVEVDLDLESLLANDSKQGMRLVAVDPGDGAEFTADGVRRILSILMQSAIKLQLRMYVVQEALAMCRPIEYRRCLQATESLDFPRRQVVMPEMLELLSEMVSPNMVFFNDFIANSPQWRTRALEASQRGMQVPEEVLPFLYGNSMSTYPDDPNNAHICDSFIARVFAQQTHLVLADGCNWGIHPANAARFACLGFLDFIEESDSGSLRNSTQGYLNLLFEAAYEAHRAILDRHARFVKNHQLEAETPAGTTTLLGGVIVENSDPSPRYGHAEDSPFLGLFVSIGDCKAYRITAEDGSFLDLTKGTRPDGLQASDPGGRIGPYVDGEFPDTRNLKLLLVPLEPDDMVVLVTDGVYDNFDPHMHGRTPHDEGLDAGSWEEVDNVAQDELRERFAAELLRRHGAKTPQEITECFLEHARNTTVHSRDFMLENPHLKLPDDYKRYPGKMDHTTCLVYRVGRHEERIEPSSAPSLFTANSIAHTPSGRAGTLAPRGASTENLAAADRPPARSPARPPVGTAAMSGNSNDHVGGNSPRSSWGGLGSLSQSGGSFDLMASMPDVVHTSPRSTYVDPPSAEAPPPELTLGLPCTSPPPSEPAQQPASAAEYRDEMSIRLRIEEIDGTVDKLMFERRKLVLDLQKFQK